MSLQNTLNKYTNAYRLKGAVPEWLSLLTRTANSRNISVTDWNIAMDDIRKVASDSMAVNDFINEFSKEFIDYYKRNIASIEYVTNPEAKLDSDSYTYTYENGEMLFKFKKSTLVEKIQIHTEGIPSDVDVVVETALKQEDGTVEYSKLTSIPFKKTSADFKDSYVVTVSKYVTHIKLNAETAPVGFITQVDFFTETTTGSYKLTRYDGVVLEIPMVNPGEFSNEIEKHVNVASYYAKASQTSAEASEKASDDAIAKVEEITGNEDGKNGFLRLDSEGFVPNSKIRDILVVSRTPVNISEFENEEDLSAYLVSLVRDGLVQTNDCVDLTKTVQVPSLNDENILVNEEVVQRSYVYLGSPNVDRMSDVNIRMSWKMLGTEYAAYSLNSKTCELASDTQKVAGVLVRFGTAEDFNTSDKKGLWIFKGYAEAVEE